MSCSAGNRTMTTGARPGVTSQGAAAAPSGGGPRRRGGGGGIALARHLRPERIRDGSAAAHGATVIRYALRSRYVHATLLQVAATPAGGGEGRPLLVFLHGRGADGQEGNANGDFFAGLRALDDRAPDVVFPNGAEHSYFHTRGSGDWARYVLDEVIPQAVRRLRADGRRVAIGGIAMGASARSTSRGSARGASALSAGTPRRCGCAGRTPRRARSTTRRTSRATT